MAPFFGNPRITSRVGWMEMNLGFGFVVLHSRKSPLNKNVVKHSYNEDTRIMKSIQYLFLGRKTKLYDWSNAIYSPYMITS